MAIAAPDVPDWLLERIQKVVEHEIERQASLVIEEAHRRLTAELPKILATVGVQVASKIEIARLGREIRITLVDATEKE